jgi:hypothetical protein
MTIMCAVIAYTREGSNLNALIIGKKKHGDPGTSGPGIIYLGQIE